MQRIGLMGGSFNPIHIGHLNMARAALAGNLVDSVVFLPSGNPPHKRIGLADKLDRYAMTCLAVQGEEKMSVSREEIDREGVIYTVDTLTRLKEKAPDASFHYLIGADTVHQLHTWRRCGDVVRLCGFLVMMRPGADEAATIREIDAWRAKGAAMSLMDGRLEDVSSSEIRDRIAAGLPVAHLLPEAVLAYIDEHKLYLAGEKQ